MTKKVLTVLVLIFLIMFGLNCLTPMCYGDDYVYAFIWPNQSMFIPLPENVERIASFKDILISQWAHYFTGNGRTVAHLLVQFFVWQGKMVFNVFNSLVFIILVLQIHWIADGGVISFRNLRVDTLCWIFFVLWTFIAGFGPVYLWLSGSCNYLWMMVVLLSFLLPYVRKYFQMDRNFYPSTIETFMFLGWGLAAGWTNENTVCWIIMFLGIWLYQCKRNNQLEKWMISGYIGLCIGYALLIIAPGNVVRASYYVTNSLNIYSQEFMKFKLTTFGQVEFLQIILWYFVLTSLKKVKKIKGNEAIMRHVNIIKLFCCLNLLSNAIMLLSPEFRVRSGFPSLVFLIIAASLVIRLQAIVQTEFIDIYARKFLTIVGGCFFLVTLIGTYRGMNIVHKYDCYVVDLAKEQRNNGIQDTLLVSESPQISDMLSWLAGQHLLGHELSEDENEWKNVAFARYYGIKGIRVIKDDNAKTDSAGKSKKESVSIPVTFQSR